jgi:transposase-like protein
MTKKTLPAEPIRFKEFSHAFKLKVVQEVENGLISKNFAAKKYLATRSTIEYWCKKLGRDMNEKNNHSTQKEIKKLKAKIEELQLITDIRQDIIDEFIKLVGEDAAKNLYPKQLIEEVRRMGRSK